MPFDGSEDVNRVKAARAVNKELSFEVAKKRMRKLIARVRNLLDDWPGFDKRTLGDQLYRSLVSVPSNMAEGEGREKGNERQFLKIALGSAQESIEQLKIARSIGLIKKDPCYVGVAVLGNTIDCIKKRLNEVENGSLHEDEWED